MQRILGNSPRRAMLLTAVIVTLSLSPSTVHGQSLEQGLRLFHAEQWPDAALALYDVVRDEEDADIRAKAEIHLAEALSRMQIYLPALIYYEDVFRTENSRYYVTAAQGLLRAQEAIHDQLLVPQILAQTLKRESLETLPRSRRDQLYYLVAELAYRQRRPEAVIEYTKTLSIPGGKYYGPGQIILGLSRNLDGTAAEALAVFKALAEAIPADATDPENQRHRSLALISAARLEYGLGHYRRSTALYRAVPRFSEQWFTALYENTWSYLQQEQFGKALGEVQSVTSPYFARRHVPEAYVVAATIYFYSCQWDRARAEVKRYRDVYGPMQKNLKAYLSAERQAGDYTADLVAGGTKLLAMDVVRDVRRQRRFINFDFVLRHARWEKTAIAGVSQWRGSALGRDLMAALHAYHQEFRAAVGEWVYLQLKGRYAALKNFANQIDLLDLETTAKEAEWLTAGEEIDKGPRARLPRPDIPNDQWQHWGFDREYWKDELGNIQHSLRSECHDTAAAH